MAGEDRRYVAAVHELPCCLAFAGGCAGRMVAHHAGSKGLSQRAHDHTCVPLCNQHHVEFHSASGAFRQLNKAQLRAWAEVAIAGTQKALAWLLRDDV